LHYPHPYPPDHLPRPSQAWQASQALQELCQQKRFRKTFKTGTKLAWVSEALKRSCQDLKDSAYIPKSFKKLLRYSKALTILSTL